MIRTLAIVGTGLIGTSIGLALRRHGVQVYLLDRDPAAAEAAAALGAGIAETPPEPVELAVIAVPPRAVASVLAEHQARGLAQNYTDVASVKAPPVREIERANTDASRYVGGHPVIDRGRIAPGPQAARADLFDARMWVLTPAPGTSRTTLNNTLELVALCGAVPFIMDCEAHDEAVALISHAPHVVASLLAGRLNQHPPDVLRLADQGAPGSMPTADGDARFWDEILSSNTEPVVRVLRELERDLSALLSVLDNPTRTQSPELGGESMTRVVDLLDRGAARTAAHPVHARSSAVLLENSTAA